MKFTAECTPTVLRGWLRPEQWSAVGLVIVKSIQDCIHLHKIQQLGQNYLQFVCGVIYSSEFITPHTPTPVGHVEQPGGEARLFEECTQCFVSRFLHVRRTIYLTIGALLAGSPCVQQQLEEFLLQYLETTTLQEQVFEGFHFTTVVARVCMQR